MENRKLTKTNKEKYKQAQDLREAIQFKHAKSVEYSADSLKYDDNLKDYIYTKIIEYKLKNIDITVDTDSIVLYENNNKQPIVVLPLAKISDIDYSYHDNTCDLVFILANKLLIFATFDCIS